MKYTKFLLAAIFATILVSCGTEKKILYFQDMKTDSTSVITNQKDIILRPMDQISILVSSKDPEMAVIFNLTRAQYRVGYNSGANGGYTNANNGEISGYTLDENGDIDFPQLGTLHLAGMTRSQAARYVKSCLLDAGLVNDPVVTVEFLNLYFSALGEVVRPGKYAITKDCITILEAISMAGDLTITGLRDRVQLIREQDGKRTTYIVDLRSTDLFNSPAYYIQQNDVIYVQPNTMKVGQSTINENNIKSVSMWVSISSFLVTLSTLIINIVKFQK